MADQLVFSESLQTTGTTQPFVEKQWIECNDVNNGVYTSNQIVFSTSSLVFSTRWVSLPEGFLRIPLVMAIYQAEASTAFGDSIYSNYAMAMKSNFTNLIHSCDIKINGSSVGSNASYQNFFYSMKDLQSYSVSDLAHLPSTNFYPDNALSWTYGDSAFGDGRGVCNNRPFTSMFSNLVNFTTADVVANTFPTANIAEAGLSTELGVQTYPLYDQLLTEQTNDGMLKRQKQYAFNPASSVYSGFLTDSNTQQVWKNYFAKVSSSPTGKALVWYINAIIPLKSFSSFFEEAPLMRSTKIDMILNINQGTAAFTATGVAATGAVPRHCTLTQTSAEFSYGVCPFLVSSGDVGQPNALLHTDTGAKTFYAGLGVVSLTPKGSYFSTTLQHTCKNSAMVVPTYMMNTSAENEYLSLSGGDKTFYYRDITSYPLTNQSGTIQPLLMTGAVKPISLSIYPFLTSTSNGGLGFAEIASIFSTAPATCAPLFTAYDYNVQVSSNNVYQNSINYNYQNFVEEITQFGTMNGNSVCSLGSGLISQVAWENLYGFLTTSLSRRVSGDSTPKSIGFKMTIKSSKAVDLYAFVEVLKSITIDLQTGNVKAIN